MASLAGNQSGVLDDEQGVLGEIAALLQGAGDLALTELSREEFAELAVQLAASAERMAAVAGRFLATGESAACSYTKGQSSMIGLVNAQGRLSRARASSLKRAGTAIYRFPHFHTALLAGTITLGHVDLMTGWAKKADSSQVADAEEALAAYAVLTTPEEFEQGLRGWVAVANPNEHLDEFIRAQARRQLVMQKDLFDNVHITGVLEPILGEQLAQTVRDNAQRLMNQDPDLGIHTAQHDALVQLVLDPNGDGVARLGIDVLVPAHDPDDLVNPDTPGRPEAGAGPVLGIDPAVDAFCYMVGRSHRATKTPTASDRSFSSIYYPRTVNGSLIPPAIITEMIRGGAKVRCHQIDADGNLINDRVNGALFTAKQKRLIELRDQHCQHDGCRRPARYCDHDHVIASHQGGPTRIANGQLLCKFHHRWKHRNDPNPGPHTTTTRLFTNTPLLE